MSNDSKRHSSSGRQKSDLINHRQISVTDLSPNLVTSFLKQNPQFLENYVVGPSVSKETFQRWSARRQLRDGHVTRSTNHLRRAASPLPKTSDEWTVESHVAKRKQLLDLSTNMDNSGNRNYLLHELMSACVQAIRADGGHLYLFDSLNEEIFFYDSDIVGLQHGIGTFYREPQPSRRYKPATGLTVAAYVARTLESVRTPDIFKDSRFPEALGVTGIACQSVLCHPIIDTSGVFHGVFELYRLKNNHPFSDKEHEVRSSEVWMLSSECFPSFDKVLSLMTLWGCLGVYFSQLFHSINKQRRLNDFLLTVTKSIFQDIISIDVLIMKIMNFAQKLVDADRASLFLVDQKSNELYARIFDVGTYGSEAESLEQNKQKEIRFPMDRGIGGFVASSGHVLNIEDAYTDERFNREIDLKTGYTTKTILCMPIFNRGSVIGIVQMVNKRVGAFTKQDEEAFETFAVYCGLALHYAKLYDKIRRSEQKYKVAIEVLTYHSVCTKEEFNKLKVKPLPERVPDLDSFDIHPRSLTELEKPLYAVFMFKELFGLQRFDLDDLIRFVLTVRKNYRVVPYHNWAHGWSVAHAMYAILKQTDVFTELEKLSMYVACLCHDLDHRGKTNAFMKSMATPLAAIYSTSVMENHHFNQTVLILQQEGHNIFKSLSSDDYKWVLGNMKHCILATDLALFFPNKTKLKQLVDEKKFSWDETSHRLLAQAVCMTACDLIASAKPWEVQTETTKVIFEEFYEQGDAELASGREPIPMMDRRKCHELPNMQVGFINGICVPCYDLLSHLIPCAGVLLDKAQYNKSKWQELADKNCAAK